LLSQWRGYGSGGGAAIIFDTEKLEKILDQESIRYEYSAMYIADVVYSDDEKKLMRKYQKILPSLQMLLKYLDFDTFFNRNHVDASKAYHPFVRCISRYKHYGFSEENEVRVIALPTIINEEIERLANKDGVKLRPEKEVKIRKKCGQEVKYIELLIRTTSNFQLIK
jgi:hypothetical protein